MAMSSNLRTALAWTHRWAGLIGGLLFCLLGVTGAIVTFRPQIGAALSPRAIPLAQCRGPVDWNAAQREIEATTGTAINRIYFPAGVDPRYHVRMQTGVDAIYTHVIYDACAGRVLGTANLQWLDWIVDLHHNFLAARTGRMFVGAVGVALLLSGIGGLALILLSATSIKRLFKVQTGDARKTFYDLHRAVGAGTAALVLLQAFTGVWLCYPQIFRFAVGAPVETQIDVRARATHSGSLAPLGDLIAAADRAIGDGRIREIRMPDGYGLVQVRMWREGDFRSLGNNVVSVDRASAQVLAVDLYDGKPASNRFLQALAGLHYGEWGGMPYRAIYGISGMATLPLFLTGCGYWWLRRRRRVPATASSPRGSREAIGSSVPTQA